MSSDPVEGLRESLQKHPADRDPLQHATAQFHLGGVLLDRGALDEAEDAFTAAAALFGARGARPEQAKALNGLGAALRAAGRLDLAARALEHATGGLASAGLSLEEGAARFNLGLVLRENEMAEPAAGALARARELLDPARVPAQAAAAARELGATQLMLGRLEDAEATLSEAIALAERARDEAARGAAANTLGLVRLADGRAQLAAEAFALAAAASPRSVRPEPFAMAKANLALAYEQAGAPERARMTARQAIATPGASEPVRDQATQVLARLGRGGSDLRRVLEAEQSDDARSRIVREELLRSAAADDHDLVADARAWLDAYTSEAIEPVEVAELWLGGLLELPPQGLERLVRSALQAAAELDPDARDEFRQAVTRAMARFHIPQWMRLQDVFSRAADDTGDPGPWR